MEFNYFLLGSLALAFIMAARSAKTGTPRYGRAVWRNEVTGKLYLYQERAGFNNVRQDWWQEVSLLPGDRILTQGDWFKYNVGYPPRHQFDMTPFVQVPERELRQAQSQLSLA